MGDLLDELMDKTEREIGDELGDEPDKKKVNPLTTLSPKELRRRFDKDGNPREGFDLDGNPIPNETKNRRAGWD